MGDVIPNLACLCQVCLTWRRLGGELARGHADRGYQIEALAKLRWVYNELTDYREANLIGLGTPVAEGVLNPIPPAPSRRGGAAVEKGSEGGAEELEERPPEEEQKDTALKGRIEDERSRGSQRKEEESRQGVQKKKKGDQWQ